MDASPTEKQSTGTVSVVGDVPQRCTSGLLHLASVWFSLSVFESGDSKTRYFLSHSAQAQVQFGRHEYSSESIKLCLKC